jgi:hypothetical protein
MSIGKEKQFSNVKIGSDSSNGPVFVLSLSLVVVNGEEEEEEGEQDEDDDGRR